MRSMVAVALLALVAGCTPEPGVSAEPYAPITIMTFNVENLFDARHDPGKDDHTFLPLSSKQSQQHQATCARIERNSWRNQCFKWDWNEQALDHKLTVVAKAILQVGEGRGPDILALQEVENLGVLERLRTEHLTAAGFRPGILIEGGDNRGIDVAFLSRLPLDGPARLHMIAFDGAPPRAARGHPGDSRGYLQTA